MQYTDANSFTVGTVNSTDGLTTDNADIVLRVVAFPNTLTLAQNLDAGTGNVRIVTGALDQTGGGITANALGVHAQDGVSLTGAANDVATLAIHNDNSGHISYRDASGFDIGAVTALGAFSGISGIAGGLGDVTLESGGAVTQSASIAAIGLELLGAGPYTLTSTGNNVVTLAGSVTGSVQYTDADSFTVGTVNLTDGLATTDADIVLETVTFPSTLTLAQNVDAGTGDVRIVTGDVDQTGGGITADALGVYTQDGVNLASATNDVATLAIRNDNSGHISYRDASGFDIGAVPALGAFGGISGILGGLGDVTLESGGAVTQTSSIAAIGLKLMGSGPYTLTNTSNLIETLAGSVAGSVQYTDADSFTVGTVGGTSGLTTTNADIVLAATAFLPNTLTLAQNVSAGTGDLRMNVGSVNQTGGAITADELGVRAVDGVSLTGANNVATLAIANANSGNVAYTDTNGFAIGTVAALGAFTPDVSGISNATRDVTLTAGAAVTQTQAITAAGLELLGAGSYALTLATNDLDTLAVSTDGAVSLRDANALVVGTVNTIGITTSSDNVTLQTGTTLAISQAVNLAGGNLTLNAGGATTQTASITAAGLELLGTGPYTLTNAGNNVATIAASTGGAISYSDATVLAVGTVNATSGVTTTGNGAVTLNVIAGALTLPATIGAIDADGAVSLTAAGGISTAADITTTDDAIGFNSATMLTGDVVLNTGAAGTAVATFGSTLNGANDLTVQGAATFNGIVGGTTPLASLQVTGATLINTSAITTATTQDYGGAMTFSSDLALAGTTVTFDSTLDGAHNLLVSGDAAFSGVVGGLAPLTSLQVSGTTSIGASAISTTTTQVYDGAVSLVSDTTLAASLVTFNSTVDGGQALTVDTAAVFNDAVGNATALAALDVSGAANVNTGILTASGGINFGSSLTGPGTSNDLAVRAGAGAFSVAGALTNVNNLTVHTASDVTLTNSNNAVSGTVRFVSATGSVDYREAGAITLGASAITGSARIVSGDGGIATTGAVSANGGIALVAHDGVTGGNSGTITIGGTLATQGAQLTLNAADNITVNGQITSNDGNVDIVAGNSAGVDYAAVRLPAGTTAADEAGSGDNFGAVHFQAGVNAGAGNLVIVTAGDASVSASDNDVTQSATGSLVSGNLSVITLKGPGGIGSGAGADIILNTSANNDNANVRFFACESAGCPLPALSGPTVPVVFAAANEYAAGQISYSGVGGVNLAGLGTVGDFYSFVNGPFTLTANPFSAGNVTIESDDDIIIDLAQNLLSISNNPSSSLNFIARRDILYVNPSYGAPGGGFTIGTPASPFNNHLNMTAVRSILLENSLYQNAQNLSFAANATINTPFQGLVAPNPLDPGHVTMRGNYTVSTGGNVSVSGIDLNVLGGDTGGAGQSLTGQSLVAGGTISLMNSGAIRVIAGTATAAPTLPADAPESGSGARVQGGTVNIGSAGTPGSNPALLHIEGGTNDVGYSTSDGSDPNLVARQANAVVVSSGDMNVYLRSTARDDVTHGVPFDDSYSLIVRGGTATANNSPAPANPLAVTAHGVLQANTLTMETAGTILFQGGTANLETGNAAAQASALLLVQDEKTIRTGGSLVLIGGNTSVSAFDAVTTAPLTSTDAANAQAIARMDPSTLTLNVDGILVLQGGKASGPAGSFASARIDAGDEIRITVNGTGNYAYTSSGGTPMAVGPASFFMIGGGDSGFFDRNNQDLAGSLAYPQAFPITVALAGPFLRIADSGLAGSVVQTGVATFDESLLAYSIFATNVETRAVGILKRFDEEDLGVAACR